jgi:hypothetical protein
MTEKEREVADGGGGGGRGHEAKSYDETSMSINHSVLSASKY